MAHKKAFTLIEMMIVVAIIAILAMVAVSQYVKYIERTRSSATSTLLQNLALAQFATQSDQHDAASGFLTIDGASAVSLANLNKLADFGFRADPQVGFVALSPVPATQDDFVIFASYRIVGAPVFVYSNSTKTGVHLYDPASIYASVIPGQLYIYNWQAATGATAIGHLTIDPAAGTVISVNIY